MINTLNGLIESILKNKNGITYFEDSITNTKYEVVAFQGEYYCPNCGIVVQSNVRLLTNSNILSKITKRSDNYNYSTKYVFNNLPWFFEATCSKCQENANIIIYQSSNDIQIAVVYSANAGYVPINAPDGVKYYIDQVYKARSAGAFSASMAMYRAALECIFVEQNFVNGTIKEKIKRLEDLIAERRGPDWISSVNPSILKYINIIANNAIHVNTDIDSQKLIDEDLLQVIDNVFAELLDKIYSQQIKNRNNLDVLKSKADQFNKY